MLSNRCLFLVRSLKTTEGHLFCRDVHTSLAEMRSSVCSSSIIASASCNCRTHWDLGPPGHGFSVVR